MGITIRDAQPEDAQALIALERASPDTGPAAVEVQLRLDHFALARRYPGSRGYVALPAPGSAPVGMLFASLAPTQLNGRLVPGAYLFALRVHPAHRRRGIASALIGHAWERARAEAAAEVAWAAIVAGNQASLAAFQRAGFDQRRALRIRLVVASALTSFPAQTELTCRPAAELDLPALADALNAHYAAHQLWRPLTPQHLSAELAATGQTPADVALCLGRAGAIVAGAHALAFASVARLRLLGWRVLPEPVNRLLRPLLSRLPFYPLLVRYAMLPSDRAATAQLLRCLCSRHPRDASTLALTLDPLDLAWSAAAAQPGINMGLDVVARSEHFIETHRPWYLG